MPGNQLGYSMSAPCGSLQPLRRSLGTRRCRSDGRLFLNAGSPKDSHHSTCHTPTITINHHHKVAHRGDCLSVCLSDLLERIGTAPRRQPSPESRSGPGIAKSTTICTPHHQNHTLSAFNHITSTSTSHSYSHTPN
jgi:hypothetical protein